MVLRTAAARAPHSAAVQDEPVVGSASIWVLGQVAGPRREATVLHADGQQVFVDLEGCCLGVLGARAVQVPCGVRTDLPRLPQVDVGETAEVVDGAVVVGDVEVLVSNIVDTTVPVLSPDDCAEAATRLDALLGEEVDGRRRSLPSAGVEGLGHADPAAASTLLGVGPGLTPLGDDVLAGWLATAVASRHPQLPEMRAAVAREAFERTGLLSATLLACAARGEGVPEFRSLLRGVAMANDPLIEQALALLMKLADTGPGLVLGALLALRDRTP